MSKEKKLDKGFCLIELVDGVEGPHISIGDHSTGFRLAGPKAWGGGQVRHSFVVNCEELIKYAKEYGKLDQPEAPTPEPAVMAGGNPVESHPFLTAAAHRDQTEKLAKPSAPAEKRMVPCPDLACLDGDRYGELCPICGGSGMVEASEGKA